MLFAQERGDGPPGFGMERSISAEYDKASFDVSRQRLPRAYGGHNIETTYNAIQSVAARAAAGVAVDGPPLSWTYAFQAMPGEILYNKHERTMRVQFPLWKILENGTVDETKNGLRIAYVPQVDNALSYTDGDGRKVEIEEVKFREYTIVFDNLDDFPLEKGPLLDAGQTKNASLSSLDEQLRRGTIVVKMAAPKEEAEGLRLNVRLLAVCTLTRPYATTETVRIAGTPEKPQEYIAQHHYLHVRLLELWSYDAFSGKVHRR